MPLYENGGKRFMPIVTWAFLAVNILYYIWLEIHGSTNDTAFMARCGTLIPQLVMNRGEYYRFVTSFFMHFGFRHLFNNMLLLWYLGIRLERYLGHVRFAALYLLGGIAANAVSFWYYMQENPFVSCAGASGAVFAIVGAMLWIVLRHRGRLVDLTARQLLLMILFTLYNGMTSAGINNTAHVAGLVVGFLLGALFYCGSATRS